MKDRATKGIIRCILDFTYPYYIRRNVKKRFLQH